MSGFRNWTWGFNWLDMVKESKFIIIVSNHYDDDNNYLQIQYIKHYKKLYSSGYFGIAHLEIQYNKTYQSRKKLIMANHCCRNFNCYFWHTRGRKATHNNLAAMVLHTPTPFLMTLMEIENPVRFYSRGNSFEFNNFFPTSDFISHQ